MSDTEPLTPARLRDVADTLDQLSKILVKMLKPVIAAAEKPDADPHDLTFGVRLTNSNGQLTPDRVRKLRDWASSTEVQDDLRRWANEMTEERR